MQNQVVYVINANVVLQDGILSDGVIVIENGKISRVCARAEVQIPADACTADANYAYVGPGFVDIHVHGGNGYCTCFAPQQAAEYFLKHGTTSFLATPCYLMDKETILNAIASIRDAMKRCAQLKGIYMEGPFMNPAYGADAASNPWCGKLSVQYCKDLIDACGTDVKVWAVAPELPDVLPFLTYARKVNPNVAIAVGHSEATPEQIRALGQLRPTIHTHIMNATGRKKVPTGTRGCGPDEYALQQEEVYAELISDSCGMHVQPDLQRLILHCKGADKVILITDGTTENNPALPQFAHIEDLNFDSNGELSGSKMTMDMACRNAVKNMHLDMVQAFLMAATNPARAIGMDDTIGSIAVGKNADLVFVDENFHVQQVMLGGVLQRENIYE